jgi:hypothetical protein
MVSPPCRRSRDNPPPQTRLLTSIIPPAGPARKDRPQQRPRTRADHPALLPSQAPPNDASHPRRTSGSACAPRSLAGGGGRPGPLLIARRRTCAGRCPPRRYRTPCPGTDLAATCRGCGAVRAGQAVVWRHVHRLPEKGDPGWGRNVAQPRSASPASAVQARLDPGGFAGPAFRAWRREPGRRLDAMSARRVSASARRRYARRGCVGLPCRAALIGPGSSVRARWKSRRAGLRSWSQHQSWC